jgi:hypothetical protein
MPENKSTHSAEPEIPVVDYAFWDVPGAALKIIYSLQLFHEIDFVVNEGYRKIPHGGIEVGGLLFGSIDHDAVRIEAFRPIECEHAYGPALHLSERDLGEVDEQLSAASSDPQLAGLQPVGWFLAHTRGPLELTDTEVEQFGRLFPQPSMVTLLVKPERFQPTRFGFLVRKADGEMPREATNGALILPLPGRVHKPGQLAASIPAPAPVAAKRTSRTPPAKAPKQGKRKALDDFEEDNEPPARVPPPPKDRPVRAAAPPPLESIWKVPPDSEVTDSENEDSTENEDAAEWAVEQRTPSERAARRQLARDRARVMEGGFPASDAAPPRPPALPSLPANLARQLPAIPDRPAYVPKAYPPPAYSRPTYASERQKPSPAPASSVLTPRSLAVLAFAALLGCVAGYFGYLQLPAPIIALDVHSSAQSVVVSWPPEETKNSVYAAIRFNDGAPVPLSAEERNAGQVSLAAAKDFKVEVMARNWIRDSRGIVRYMRPANGSFLPLPAALP